MAENKKEPDLFPLWYNFLNQPIYMPICYGYEYSWKDDVGYDDLWSFTPIFQWSNTHCVRIVLTKSIKHNILSGYLFLPFA